MKIEYDACLKQIDGVCNGCGGKLEPLKTIDNSGNPTYWSGCRHCSKFCWGVKKEIFDIAREMVEKENFVAYVHLDNPKHKKDVKPEEIEYYLDSQTAGACRVVSDILRIQSQLQKKLEGEKQ